MPHSKFQNIRLARTDVPQRRVRWLVAPIIAVTICLCAICGRVLIDAHHAAWERAGEVAASLVAAIEADTMRNIESIDLSLQAVIDGLQQPEIERVSPQLRQLILFDRAATARHLGGMVVLDGKGDLRFDSRSLEPRPANYAARDYFQAHKARDDLGLYIGRPYVGATGRDIVGVSRRLSHPDGSFAGVAAGILRLEYFQHLFKDIALGPNSNVTLAASDGTVLMRWPYRKEYIGRDMSYAELFKHLERSRTGRFETYVNVDNANRLYVYSQIGDLPLVVSVGQATDDIYAQWRHQALLIALLMAALCALTITLAIFLNRELKLRRMNERQLAMLATTDGLTGLSNCRHFRETLDREWGRAMRERAPIAMLMIDADLFKAYNDRHGHVAGDTLLQAIARAIADTLKRPADLGARYGGDEFAVLLPATTLDGAAAVAAELRKRFSDICSERELHHDGAQLSIGVSCLTPRSALRCGDLVAAADQALYRAKNSGRNRTELAREPAVERPADVVTAAPQESRAA